MLKLHLILALRNLLKRRFYASIEIAGLAIGLACLVVILLHFRKETSYDKFVTDYKKIFRVLNLESGTGNRYSGGASALGLHARTEVPGITELVRVFFPYRMFSTSALISIDDRRFYEDNIIEADSNFFRMFDFTLLEGYAGSALRHPNSVVISERVAIRLFGRQPALGKTLQIDGGELQVSGVARVPQNTHLAFDFLRPAHHNPGQLNVWEHTLAFTYLKVRDPELVPEIERQLHDIILKNATTENTDYLKSYFQILQPLAEIHNTVIQWDIVKPVSRMQLWSILGLAVFILLLAVTNFVNLTTARAGERMKETGISKILGASRRRLTMQFFAEFFIASVLAGALALIFLPWLTKVFNAAMNTSLDSREIMELPMILLFIFTLIVTAVLSGVYPAAKLSRFRPTDVFKRATSTGRPQHRLRSILVVFQFVISIGLLSGTFIVRNQVQFLQKADLGFNKEHVYIVRFRQADPARFERLKNLLLTRPQIAGIAGASALLGGEPGSDTFHPDHMPDATPETFAKNIAVDPGFLDLMHIPLLAGRNFQTDNPADRSVAYIINETAVKQFQLRDPIGENFRRRGDSTGRIIGVMKDFHFASMSENIHPMVFYMDTLRSYRYMFVRMHGDIPAAIDGVKEAWASVMPEWPMEGFFQDEYFNALYKQEEQLQRITGWFSVLAMALAALGLLGLSSFVILHRTKEIGIRKVIGASVPDILVLLSAHFLKLIFFSLLISIPLTVFLIDQWLQGFVARISIGAGYFLVAGICTTAVALITIGFQSIRAALANPVNAIRGE